jgi:hypothetical protein
MIHLDNMCYKLNKAFLPFVTFKLLMWKHVIFSFWTISETEITFASITEATDVFFSGFGLGISSEQTKLSRFRGYDLSDVIFYFT